MIKEEYIDHVAKILKKEGLTSSLQLQILETVTELMDYYSVEFVQDLLPTLFQPK